MFKPNGRKWFKSLILAAVILTVSMVPVLAQGPDLIKDVQVTQVFGKQLEGRKDYVAGKDTVIRVLLSAETPLDPTAQKVVVKRDGAAVVTLDPSPGLSTATALTFTCASREACGDWKAGKYIFEVTIGTATKTTDELAFLDRRPLRVLAVGMKNNYGSGVIKTTTGKWKQGDTFLKQVYPVAPSTLKWTIGQELDLSDPKYDLTKADSTTGEGRPNVWLALANLQPKECANDPLAANCYDLIVGFMATDVTLDKGLLGGYTYGAPANIVSEGNSAMEGVVAHEIAHVYNVGDEYDQLGGAFYCKVNPPPATFVGRNFDLPKDDPNFAKDGYSCTDSKEVPFPSQMGAGDLVKADTYFPYEVGGRGLLPDSMSFMGSGETQDKLWTTPRIYASLFDTLSLTGKTARLGGLAQLVTPVKYIYATGFIPRDPTKNKVKVDPWMSYMDDAPFVQTKGLYSIEAQDASGKALASQGFNLSFVAKTNPPTDIDEAPFEQGLPFPDGTQKFVIKKGDTVLYERTVPANSPEVKITAPASGETISSTYTIKWQGTHKDGLKLTYDVEFSQDGDPNNFICLATDLTDTSWTDDFATLPGGSKAMIRITATDGVNATEVLSANFTVPPKAPEVYIDEPEKDITIKAGEEIALSGSAYDLQDEDIYDDKSLVWTSDLQGVLGGGELIFVDNLKPGKHTITLTATNSLKLSSTAKIVVTVQ